MGTSAYVIIHEDVFTHLNDFRLACVIAKEHAKTAAPDIDDKSYWQKQIDVIDNILSKPHEVKGPLVSTETLKVHPLHIEELEDEIEALDSELNEAIKVALNHGAIDWVRLNYPKHYERLTNV